MIVPLLGPGIQGKSEVISAQHRINCYVEMSGDPDKSSLSIIGTPGLELFCDLDAIPFYQTGAVASLGSGPIRAIQPWVYGYTGTTGFINREEALLVVRGNKIIAINKDGRYLTQTGVLVGADVTADTGILDSGIYQISGVRYCLFADGQKLLYFSDFPALTWRRVSDGDAVNASTLAAFGTDILVTVQGSEKFYLTPDLTNWDPLDFASAESQPDELVRVYRNGDTVILFGESGVEFWAKSDSLDFAYVPIKGTNVDFGIEAKWSVAKVGGAVVYLARNPAGQVSLVRLVGYQASKVSSQDWDVLINDYIETADAEAFAYTMGGHAFYQITFPRAEKSWLFDATTGVFSELQSDTFGRHRARLNAFAFGDHFVTDYDNGKIYRFRHDIYSDNGVPMAMELRTKHFFKDYQNVTVNSLHLDVESAVGVSGADVVLATLTKSDTFTRANETPLASPWATSLSDGGANLDTNAVVATAGTTKGSHYPESWHPNQWSQGTVSNLISNVNTRPGVSVRMDASGNGFGVLVSGAATDNDIVKFTASTMSILGSFSTAFANSDVLKLEVSGVSPDITLTVYKNGAQVSQLTGITGKDTGSPGVFARGGGVIDTWTGTSTLTAEAYGTEPKVMMQYSTDNGRGWSSELWESMGVGGDTLKRAEWRRLGIGRDFTFRIRISDPVKRVLTGMSIDATPGRR